METLKYPGLIEDSFDPRDVWEDEVIGGEVSLPEKYLIEGLVYERQGGYPFCASFAATTLLEYKYQKAGEECAFSQPHLFFRAGGTTTGSTFRNNLEVARKSGLIPYPEMPMPGIVPKDNWYPTLRDEAFRIPFKDPKKLLNYVKVSPDREKIKAALLRHGPLLIGVCAKGDYYKGHSKRTYDYDNHAVLLVGWDERDWIIFDSLSWAQKTNGYVTLDISYTFRSVYAVTELPDNWKEYVTEKREKPFENALNHYGKVRDFEAEQRFATKLLDAFNAFNNKSVTDAAGRFWPILINAGVYGGYSLDYYKWGRWQPGDLINFVYHWRRTGEYLFDLNKPRQLTS